MDTAGPNSISGRAALVREWGSFKLCERGSEIFLIPETAISAERMKRIFGTTDGGYARWYTFERWPQDKSERDAFRGTICDKAGDFQFDHVADGKYFVLTEITWLMRWAHHGGALMQSVAVAGGEHRNVLLQAKEY